MSKAFDNTSRPVEKGDREAQRAAETLLADTATAGAGDSKATKGRGDLADEGLQMRRFTETGLARAYDVNGRVAAAAKEHPDAVRDILQRNGISFS